MRHLRAPAQTPSGEHTAQGAQAAGSAPAPDTRNSSRYNTCGGRETEKRFQCYPWAQGVSAQLHTAPRPPSTLLKPVKLEKHTAIHLSEETELGGESMSNQYYRPHVLVIFHKYL